MLGLCSCYFPVASAAGSSGDVQTSCAAADVEAERYSSWYGGVIINDEAAAVVEADDAAMDEAEVCLARKQEHYHMAADDSDPGSIDPDVYEYAFNGGVMGYHDTAQELELSVEYPDGTEEPDEGLHLDGGEDPDGDRLNWNRTSESGPAVWLSSAVDLEPSTPSPTAVERDTSEMLDFLAAQPQRDQLQADPEPPRRQ
jgi:hypothetical protein